MSRPSLLEILAERPIVGDGSYVWTLEKRGYVRAGPYTPECIVEHPYAVEQLHREYLWAGADVIEAFSFYANDGKMQSADSARMYTSKDLNQAACDVAHKIANPVGALICGGISPTPSYEGGKGEPEVVKQEFRKQVEVFKDSSVDYLLGEFFGYVEEAEFALGVMKEAGLPVALTMRTGLSGDFHDVSPEECAVRLAKAGADVLGVNCSFDPDTCVQVIRRMKEGLEQAGLQRYLMLQPCGFHCPDVKLEKDGFHQLPEYPFALEPRTLTRWDVRKFARDAYNAGVQYIGGCCGFEPYHIREIAEELAPEIGHRPRGQEKNGPWASGLSESCWPILRDKASKDFWQGIKPSSGRPLCPSYSGRQDQ